MSEIRIESQADEARLHSLGVRDWPVWSAEPSEFPWTYDQTETCYLLEGKNLQPFLSTRWSPSHEQKNRSACPSAP